MVKPAQVVEQQTSRIEGAVLEVTRLVAAPQELVFAAFSDPVHLPQWWGPNGFNTTVHSMDFRVGGGWSFTMHGPDGTDYPNFVRYTLIEPPDRIEYDHGVSPDDANPHFRARITLTPEGDGTRVALRMELPSVAALEEVRRFGAVQGAEQTLSRLAALLEAA